MKSPKTGEEECRHLFRMRMQRDGREKELDELIAKHKEDGKSRRQSICAAMREMGYPGPAKERRLWEAAKGKAMMNRRRQNNRDFKKKYYRKMRNQALDEVMDTLKPNAPPEQELDWVTAHRKLFHVQQLLLNADSSDEAQKELKDALKLTAEDIKTAPSQSAVTMLLSALEAPSEWMRKKRDAHKSKTGAGSGGEGDTSDVTDDLEEIERMIKAASNG
jgi:hypothetical protein